MPTFGYADIQQHAGYKKRQEIISILLGLAYIN